MPHPFSRDLCSPKVGQRFRIAGREYVMAGALGDGAAGLVRKATRTADGTTVAVKLLAPDPKYIDEAAFDDVAGRFKREGERGVRLRHPHLVAIEAYSDNTDGAFVTLAD
jgi:serine/threonine protein kinase